MRRRGDTRRVILISSSALKLAENGQSTDAAMRYRVPIQASLDGNTVELATEQTSFTENAIAYGVDRIAVQ